MEHPILYRKRLIPQECVLLADDIILFQDSQKLITKWHTLHPKKIFITAIPAIVWTKG